MTQITSRENPTIKEYTKLCTSKRTRAASGRFGLEGARLIADCVQSGCKLQTLLLTEQGLRRLGEQADLVMQAAEQVLQISDALAARIGETQTPQGVFAIGVGQPCGQALPLQPQALPPFYQNGALLLCSLQDPGNVGTIFRSAEAFGLSCVMMTDDCPDPLSPKVLRASMGAALRLPVCRVPRPVEAVAALRQSGAAVYAAALQPNSVPVRQLPLARAVVAIGNEGAGLAPDVVAACNCAALLPIAPQCESLNAAMAASIFAWELRCAAQAQEGEAPHVR